MHAKNHTFTRRICNTQITNTLRTFRECILNGLRMRGEHYTKCVANNPLGVGADSSRPYPDINKKRVSVSLNTHIHIIKYTHSFHHTRIFFPHFVGVFIYAGAINRPLQLLVVCQNAANTHEMDCETPRQA